MTVDHRPLHIVDDEATASICISDGDVYLARACYLYAGDTEARREAYEGVERIVDAYNEAPALRAESASLRSELALIQRTIDFGPVKPTHLRCHWCCLAAGDSEEAWLSAAQRPLEEAREHEATCANQLPVVAMADMRDRYERRIAHLLLQLQGHDFSPEVAQLRDRVAEIEPRLFAAEARCGDLAGEVERLTAEERKWRHGGADGIDRMADHLGAAQTEIASLRTDLAEERARLSDQIATHEEAVSRQAAVTNRLADDNVRLRREVAQLGADLSNVAARETAALRAELERVTRERDEAIAARQDAAAKAAEAVEMWPEIVSLRAKVATLEAEAWPEDNVGHSTCGSCQYNASHGAEAEELRKGVEGVIESTDDEDDTRCALIELLDRIDARDSLAYVTELDAARAEATRLTAIIEAARSPLESALDRLEEGSPELPTKQDGWPQKSPASLEVASRCECCCQLMSIGTPVATFYDDEQGDLVAHWGKCPEPERWFIEAWFHERSDEWTKARTGIALPYEEAWAGARGAIGKRHVRNVRLVRQRAANGGDRG